MSGVRISRRAARLAIAASFTWLALAGCEDIGGVGDNGSSSSLTCDPSQCDEGEHCSATSGECEPCEAGDDDDACMGPGPGGAQDAGSSSGSGGPGSDAGRDSSAGEDDEECEPEGSQDDSACDPCSDTRPCGGDLSCLDGQCRECLEGDVAGACQPFVEVCEQGFCKAVESSDEADP